MIGEGGYRGDPIPARLHKELSRVETKQGQPTIRQRQRQRQRQTLYAYKASQTKNKTGTYEPGFAVNKKAEHFAPYNEH